MSAVQVCGPSELSAGLSSRVDGRTHWQKEADRKQDGAVHLQRMIGPYGVSGDLKRVSRSARPFQVFQEQPEPAADCK